MLIWLETPETRNVNDSGEISSFRIASVWWNKKDTLLVAQSDRGLVYIHKNREGFKAPGSPE